MIYHYQFGVYVDAATAQDAWEQVREISEKLDKIDAEGESATEIIEIFAKIEDSPRKPMWSAKGSVL